MVLKFSLQERVVGSRDALEKDTKVSDTKGELSILHPPPYSAVG